MSHLLSLSELHAEAPGVLDVVFGADGDFEGAPCWTPSGWEIHPMLTDPHYAPAKPTDIPHLWLPGHGWAFRTFTELSLDLRQSSVATRLAGLCAQALGFNADDGWRIVYSEHIGFELITARCTQFSESGGSRESWRFTGVPWRRGPPVIAGCSERWTCEMFLAALTLALAPRIRDLSRRES